MRSVIQVFICLCAFILNTSTFAGKDAFSTGPVFDSFGENAKIKNGLASPEQKKFKIAFDVYKPSEEGKANKGFNTAARFINMHVRAGVPLENIEVAIVMHGSASKELLKPEVYKARFKSDNPSAIMLEELIATGVKVQLCGQTASYYDLANDDLIDGVEMSLSAMTAHALLQQQGYTLNPF